MKGEVAAKSGFQATTDTVAKNTEQKPDEPVLKDDEKAKQEKGERASHHFSM